MSFREEVRRTANPVLFKDNNPDTVNDALLYGVIGLSGESGEVIDLVKKYKFHGKDFDKEKLIKELGDCRWYLELIAISLNVTLEEIENKNVEKLRERYPQGFSAKASEERRDVIRDVINETEAGFNGA